MLFLASLIGMDKSAPSTRSMLGVPAAAASIVLCLISSVLLVGIWFNASGVEAFITGSSLTPNLAKLAGHISVVFDKSLLLYVAVAIQGLRQILGSISVGQSAIADA